MITRKSLDPETLKPYQEKKKVKFSQMTIWWHVLQALKIFINSISRKYSSKSKSSKKWLEVYKDSMTESFKTTEVESSKMPNYSD